MQRLPIRSTDKQQAGTLGPRKNAGRPRRGKNKNPQHVEVKATSPPVNDRRSTQDNDDGDERILLRLRQPCIAS